jgi:hypothetical protein
MRRELHLLCILVFCICMHSSLHASNTKGGGDKGASVKKDPLDLSNCEIEQINKFNRLFGDYFYVNENMEIRALKDTTYSFDDFYKFVREQNWNTEFDTNLDESPILRQDFPNVITMNLKFKAGGEFFQEASRPKEEKWEELKFKKKQLFESDTMQKINAYYRNLNNVQQKADGSKADSIDKLLTQAFQGLAYNQQYDENGYNLQKFAADIKEKIKKHHIKHIYFFAHGYNVPHALAQMQGHRLLKQIRTLHTDTILFVRVFWKGGDAKKLKVKRKMVGNRLVLKKVVYKDKISLKNAIGFRRKTKEATKCGHALRRLLSLLEDGPVETDPRTFHLLSHSMGAVILSHCLVNDISPIRYKTDELIRITKEAHYVLDSYWMRRADSLLYAGDCKRFPGRRKCMERRAEALRDITYMRETLLPALNIRVFMNAPAIPGVPLFRFADVCRHYKFIAGFNTFDPTLAKRFFNKKILVSGKFSRIAGNTSLGLNSHNEIGQTEFLISMNKLKNPNYCFRGYRTSNFFEHDLFYYMQHPLFMNALKDFTTR